MPPQPAKAETRAFFEKGKVRDVIDDAAFRAAMTAVRRVIAQFSQQVAIWEEHLALLESAEDRPDILGLCEEMHQKLGAAERIMSKAGTGITTQLRALEQTEREITAMFELMERTADGEPTPPGHESVAAGEEPPARGSAAPTVEVP